MLLMSNTIVIIFLTEYKAIPETCLYDNGGCEHFCQEKEGQRYCSCADGYFLGANGEKCFTQGKAITYIC